MSVSLYPPVPQVKGPRTTRPARSKHRTRTLRVDRDPFATNAAEGLVRITIGGVPTLYRTRRFHCDPEFGPFAFSFAKVDEFHQPQGEHYDLSISSTDPTSAVITCDCIGHSRYGYCKHAAALRVLMSRREA